MADMHADPLASHSVQEEKQVIGSEENKDKQCDIGIQAKRIQCSKETLAMHEFSQRAIGLLLDTCMRCHHASEVFYRRQLERTFMLVYREVIR